jgi:gamma-glutamyl-gamma-aminobutyrate hydrolase PuuD
VKPLIGITSYAEKVQMGVWTEPSALVPLAYTKAVEVAGGRPMVIPPVHGAVEETLDALHGVIFSGGGDLDPELYGADAHPATDRPKPWRDKPELELLEAALARDMPVLAICRGSQLLNVARGGDLVQHLPEIVGHDRHKHQPGYFSDHDVSIAQESRLGSILGEHAPVKSHHHQGMGKLGDGLRPVAWDEDGYVEGLEDPDKRFALGVLWHPEEGEDYALFKSLVEEAERYRQERAA